MTTQTMTADRLGVAGQRSGASAGLLARLAAWWDERRRIARTVAELDQLSDAELDDIGISRADILDVARGVARPCR
jgi:uncharacterized protein YjiS (DUF1127 family)